MINDDAQREQKVVIVREKYYYKIKHFLSHIAKSVICKILGCHSTTFLAHLFGKIDSFLLFCSLRSPRKCG